MIPAFLFCFLFCCSVSCSVVLFLVVFLVLFLEFLPTLFIPLRNFLQKFQLLPNGQLLALHTFSPLFYVYIIGKCMNPLPHDVHVL